MLKLVLDVHLLEHVVAMQYDGSSPKPPQRFKPKEFPAWVQKQIAQGWQVISCYEAGPFGYGLHRELTKLGVPHHVIRPRHWDGEHKRVKTDRTDALAILPALDRFVAGKPTRAGVGARAHRSPGTLPHREPFAAESPERFETHCPTRPRPGAPIRLTASRGCWYGPRIWPQLEIPGWLATLLTPLQAAASALNQLVKEQMGQIESQSTQPRP